jgi:hypothetical protein
VRGFHFGATDSQKRPFEGDKLTAGPRLKADVLSRNTARNVELFHLLKRYKGRRIIIVSPTLSS